MPVGCDLHVARNVLYKAISRTVVYKHVSFSKILRTSHKIHACTSLASVRFKSSCSYRIIETLYHKLTYVYPIIIIIVIATILKLSSSVLFRAINLMIINIIVDNIEKFPWYDYYGNWYHGFAIIKVVQPYFNVFTTPQFPLYLYSFTYVMVCI